jgi:hypothetical protein
VQPRILLSMWVSLCGPFPERWYVADPLLAAAPSSLFSVVVLVVRSVAQEELEESQIHVVFCFRMGPCVLVALCVRACSRRRSAMCAGYEGAFEAICSNADFVQPLRHVFH